MYCINIITPHHTIDFAAEELKKYLRMLMPRCGGISIRFDRDAADGFRLGLMQDFALEAPEVEDARLDDVVYLHTDSSGGIIAGSNPVALLIAVYRYLRFCGCRWLLPGIDGEWIPTVEALPVVEYRKKADNRYRGMCNEGAEFQQNMIEAIDFAPKVGLNTFMLEFDIPSHYYQCYYQHTVNTERRPELVTNETIQKWKRQCEAEIEKRGLHFHDMGHGWTAEPFGIASNGNWDKVSDEIVPKESVQYLAQIAGERKLFKGVPLNTNICYSNALARRKIVQAVAEYAERQSNVDFLHVWLADCPNNHCECDACRQRRPSDWYILLLNEIDEELERRQLDTRIVFIVYTDTFWPPLQSRLKNIKRFSLLYAPISRRYVLSDTYEVDADVNGIVPFELNNNAWPNGMSASLGYLEKWRELWEGDCFSYEYHFLVHQFCDPTGLYIAKLIYQDIHGLKKHGLRGIVEDGSQRSFFPNAFAFFVYGETLFDTSVSFDMLMEDYFSHAYGNEWREALAYLQALSNCFYVPYFYGCGSAGNGEKTPNTGHMTDQMMAERVTCVKEIAERFAPQIQSFRDQPYRASSVCWDLLDEHRTLVCGIAEIVAKNASGDHDEALRLQQELMAYLSKQEVYLERYFDLYIFWHSGKYFGYFN